MKKIKPLRVGYSKTPVLDRDYGEYVIPGNIQMAEKINELVSAVTELQNTRKGNGI